MVLREVRAIGSGDARRLSGDVSAGATLSTFRGGKRMGQKERREKLLGARHQAQTLRTAPAVKVLPGDRI
jgi:hypothetical protein